MKRQKLYFPLALALTLLLASVPMKAAGGHGGGGGHGGHGGGGHHGGGVVVVGGGWGGWGWGWGWGWGGWYGYPGYYPGYGYAGYYEQNSRWAVIDTDISPEEAWVYLDGKLIGTADDFDGHPDYLYLGPGHYRIEFRLEGFETIVKEVDAEPGMYLDFKDKMPKVAGAQHHGSYNSPNLGGPIRRYFAKRGRGNSSTEPYRAPNSYGEGSDGGYYPPSTDEIQVAPAPREPVRDQSGDRWRGNRVDHGQVRTRLRMTVQPGDAAVYVDNRFVGTAEEVNSLELGVSVPPGRHVITVSRPGFREKSVEVTVEEGQTGTLDVTLVH